MKKNLVGIAYRLDKEFYLAVIHYKTKVSSFIKFSNIDKMSEYCDKRNIKCVHIIYIDKLRLHSCIMIELVTLVDRLLEAFVQPIGTIYRSDTNFLSNGYGDSLNKVLCEIFYYLGKLCGLPVSLCDTNNIIDSVSCKIIFDSNKYKIDNMFITFDRGICYSCQYDINSKFVLEDNKSRYGLLFPTIYIISGNSVHIFDYAVDVLLSDAMY